VILDPTTIMPWLVDAVLVAAAWALFWNGCVAVRDLMRRRAICRRS
jgi:hypothetical protein